jgi:hypothetical protein
MAQTVGDLETCLANAKSQGERNKCMKDFTDSGGTNRQDGGKVFSDSTGAQLATTQDGGKVFHPKQ